MHQRNGGHQEEAGFYKPSEEQIGLSINVHIEFTEETQSKLTEFVKMRFS